MKRFYRWTWRALLLLIILLATFMFMIEENVRGQIALARYKAELRGKGEKLTLAELGSQDFRQRKRTRTTGN